MVPASRVGDAGPSPRDHNARMHSRSHFPKKTDQNFANLMPPQGLASRTKGHTTMAPDSQVIEITAGEIAAELARRGIGSDERVTITIESARELIPGRRESRANVVAAGLTDDDIDRLIKQAQQEVEPTIG